MIHKPLTEHSSEASNKLRVWSRNHTLDRLLTTISGWFEKNSMYVSAGWLFRVWAARTEDCSVSDATQCCIMLVKHCSEVILEALVRHLSATCTAKCCPVEQVMFLEICTTLVEVFKKKKCCMFTGFNCTIFTGVHLNGTTPIIAIVCDIRFLFLTTTSEDLNKDWPTFRLLTLSNLLLLLNLSVKLLKMCSKL